MHRSKHLSQFALSTVVDVAENHPFSTQTPKAIHGRLCRKFKNLKAVLKTLNTQVFKQSDVPSLLSLNGSLTGSLEPINNLAHIVRTINDKAAPILIEINALCQAIEQLDAQIEQLTQTVKGRIVRPSICKALEEEIILKQRAMQARFAEIAMIENTTSNVSAMQLEAFMHQLENGLDATLTAEDFIVLGQNGAVQELKFNVLNTVQDLINKNQLFHSAFLPILQALVKANILKLVNGKPCIEIKEGPQERFEWIKANPPSFFLVNLEDFIKDSVLEFNLQAKNAVNNLTQRLIKV